jgi:hypothetical protein
VVDNFFWCQVNYLVLNKLFGVPSIIFGDENIIFGATTILFGGALNGCQIFVSLCFTGFFSIYLLLLMIYVVLFSLLRNAMHLTLKLSNDFFIIVIF